MCIWESVTFAGISHVLGLEEKAQGESAVGRAVSGPRAPQYPVGKRREELAKERCPGQNDQGTRTRAPDGERWETERPARRGPSGGVLAGPDRSDPGQRYRGGRAGSRDTQLVALASPLPRKW